MATSARIEELKKKFDENPRRYFAPLASEYRKAGMVDEAIRICREHLPAQPGHMSGHVIYGQALYDAGQRDEARGAFETALNLDPENLIALRYLGDIARERGENDVARNWYERYLDADPRNGEVSAQLQALMSESPGDAAAASAATLPPTTEPAAGAAASWGQVDLAAPTTSTAERRSSDPQPIEPLPSPIDVAALDLAPTVPAPAPAPAATTGPRRTSEVERELFGGELSQTAESPAPAARAAEPPAPAPAEPLERSTELDLTWLTGPPETSAGQPSAPPGQPAGVSSGGGAELGLETMEFTPPPRESAGSTRAIGLEPTAHDALGGAVTEPGARPSETRAAFVTETMAELYLQQGFEQEALNVYRQLLEQNPGDHGLRDRVEQLERGARSSVGVAAISDDVIEAARTRQAAPRVRTARALFGALAARRVRRGDASGGDFASAATAGLPLLGDEVERPTAESDLAVAGLPDESLPFADVPAAPESELPAAITPSELAVMAGAPTVRDESIGDSFDLVTPDGGDEVTAESAESAETAAPAVYDPLVDAPPAEFEVPAPAATSAEVAAEPPDAAPDAADEFEAFVWSDAVAGAAEAERQPAQDAVEPTTDYSNQDSATDEFRVPLDGSAGGYGELTPPAAAAELAEADTLETPAARFEEAAASAYDLPGTDAVGYDRPASGADAIDLPELPELPEASELPEAPMSAAAPAAAAPPPGPGASASGTPGGGVDALFGGARAAREDEAAAAALAGAFGAEAAPPERSAPPAGMFGAPADAPGRGGRPTAETGAQPVSGNPSRPASTPLSLDHVFREPRRPGDARRDSLAFSFDQFFAESGPPAPDAAAAAGGAPDAPSAEPSPNDLEQFNSWLEGLKKK